MERPIASEAVAQVPLQRAQAILDRDPADAFGSPVADVRPRRYQTTIAVQGLGGIRVSHPIEIEAHPTHADDDRSELAFSWGPSGGGESMLPTFDGSLEFTALDTRTTRLRLDGRYRVPLGALGRFGDGVVGHRIARQSVGGLLDTIVERIEHQALDRSRQAPTIPAPHAPDLRGSPRSESPIA